VFGTGDDQHLYQTIYSGGVWSAMQDLGGYVHGGPGLTYRSDVSRYDLFGVGGTGHIYQQTYTGGSWSGWNDIISGVDFGTGASTQGAQVVAKAKSQDMVPYCLGSGGLNGPTVGCGFPHAYDCSGLTMYAVYQGAGVVLPHSAALQYTDYGRLGGVRIDSTSDLLPGDLVFFVGAHGSKTAPGHVGVYIGGGQMVDAPNDGIPVGERGLYDDYVGAVRYWHGTTMPAGRDGFRPGRPARPPEPPPTAGRCRSVRPRWLFCKCGPVAPLRAGPQIMLARSAGGWF